MEIDGDEEAPEDEGVPAWNEKNAKDIPSSVRDALHVAFGISASKAIFSSDMKISGFLHSVQQKHAGNSQIIYSTTSTETIPGFIYHIFSLEHDARQFLAVRRLLPATVKDPFSAYPLLGVQMYSNVVSEFEIITSDNVDAQFASCHLEWEDTHNVAIISLSRVSPLLTCSVSMR